VKHSALVSAKCLIRNLQAAIPFDLRLRNREDRKGRTFFSLASGSRSMAKHAPRFLQIVNDARSLIRECTVAEVKARIDAGDQFCLVDVREESEFAAGRIPGAIHLGKGVIERDIEARIPDPNAEIVLYCGGGYRSALAADNLQKMGYVAVISMDGGFRGWNEAGCPVER
jgi:rhodanese-related sulfurtransferase